MQMYDDAKDSQVHRPIMDTIRGIEERQYAIARQNYWNACLYANRELPGVDWSNSQVRDVNYAPVSNSAENLTSSVVETISALIGKNKPKPTPVVKDASFSIERQARLLDRIIYGEFQANDVYEKAQAAFTDSLWAAVGAIKLDLEYDEDGDPVDFYVEHVAPDEIIIDQNEAIRGMPLQMYQRKLVPRATLMAMYPDCEQQLQAAQGDNFSYTSYRTPHHDLVIVVEAWRLPFLGQEGRHSIICDGVTLVDEVYERERFPFVFFKWFPLTGSFYARPLVEEIAPYQLRHNELNYRIMLAQDIVSVPRMFADQNTRIHVEQLDNSIAKVIRYQGRLPDMLNWQAVHPELYQERERNRAGAFEQAGISQMSAQGKIPEGVRLDSSRALREVNLIENQRYAKQAQMHQNKHLEIAEHIVELLTILDAAGVNRTTKFHNRTIVEEIDWPQVRELVTSGSFVLQIEASSVNNMTPAARDDVINTWIARGWIPLERGLALLGQPDLEEEMRHLSAGIDWVKYALDQLDKGDDLDKFPVVTAYNDAELAVSMAQLQLNHRMTQVDVPDEVLENYEIFISATQGLIDQGTAIADASEKQAAEQAAAQMGMAPGLEGPPVAMSPEGVPLPGVATTAQGTPIEGLI